MTDPPVIRHLGSLLADLVDSADHALRALHAHDDVMAEMKLRRVLELLTGRRE